MTETAVQENACNAMRSLAPQINGGLEMQWPYRPRLGPDRSSRKHIVAAHSASLWLMTALTLAAFSEGEVVQNLSFEEEHFAQLSPTGSPPGQGGFRHEPYPSYWYRQRVPYGDLRGWSPGAGDTPPRFYHPRYHRRYCSPLRYLGRHPHDQYGIGGRWYGFWNGC